MRPLALLTAGLLLVSGCGGLADSRGATGPSDGPTDERIAGTRVGAMAEHQLEVSNPGMAVGKITCPDLVLAVGRSVRCQRIAELTGGRRIRVLGRVTVTSLADGGRLHVRLDDDIVEFGVTGKRLAGELAAVLAKREQRTTTVRCPYLVGKTGHAVRCLFHTHGKAERVRVVVTGVDASTSETRYRFDWSSLPVRAQRSLAYVAVRPSAVMGLSRDHRSRAAA